MNLNNLRVLSVLPGLGVIFLQAFIQNMFSGGLYAASWFAIGAGIILGFEFDKLQNWNVKGKDDVI